MGNKMATLPFLLPVKFVHNVRLSSYLINTIMGLIRLVVSVVFHTSPEKPSQYLKIQKTRLNFRLSDDILFMDTCNLWLILKCYPCAWIVPVVFVNFTFRFVHIGYESFRQFSLKVSM